MSDAPVAAKGSFPVPETLQFPRWTVLRCDRRQMAQELNSGASRVIPDLLQVQEPTGCAPLCVVVKFDWSPRAYGPALIRNNKDLETEQYIQE